MCTFAVKKSILRKGLLKGFTDWHSHILPGVDDGVREMDEALDLLALYEEWGVSEVWLTPHVMEDIPNATDDLRQRFADLCGAYGGSVSLHLASENMLDNLFVARLESNDFLPLGEDGTHLLVETSYFNPPVGMDELLERTMQRGYFPVLAHPERYVYMGKEDYRRLKSKGVKFQLDFLSLSGHYGEAARQKSEWLLASGMYDLAGTDVHSRRSLAHRVPSMRLGGRRLRELETVMSRRL